MCQLLGLAFNQNVRLSLSFRGFRHRADDNPDGWGIAAFPDGSAQIFKEPIEANKSGLAEFVRDYDALTSSIFIGHVRRASVGKELLLKNTHPFCREVRGKHLVLAHNGTLNKSALKRMLNGRFSSVGETDSETLLCAVATWIVEESVPLTGFERIQAHLTELNSHGKMNLLFSDGEHLFAYCDRDANGDTGLRFTERKAPFQAVSLTDEDWEVNLADEKRPDQRGFVTATVPLTTNEEWKPLNPGTLHVFKNGATVFPTTAH
jgi:glutamine amidotransferase